MWGWSVCIGELLVRRVRTVGLFLGVLASFGLVTGAVAAPAHANHPGPIFSRASGLCLQPTGRLVAQATCAGTPEQQWLPVVLGGDYSISHLETGECLGVRDGVVQPGACDGGDSTTWAVVSVDLGYTTYVNVGTGMCLAAPGESPGPMLVQPCGCGGGVPAQQFTFPR